MELLDRYLHAVRFWLPKTQQDDIIAELGDDIRSQIEDRESALDRPLNDDELVALLQQTGHPMRVAARYQPQQSLIGPVLFPLYEFVLKIVIFCYLAPWVLVWLGMVLFVPTYRAAHPGMALLGTWSTFWMTALSLFGTITVVFAILERIQARLSWLNQWDPRKLPRVKHPKQRVSRVESVFGLVFSIVFVVWWLGLPRYGYLMFGPVAGMLSLNPALRTYFLPAVAPTLILIVQQGINLFRPQWTWLRASAMLIADAITLGIVVLVARLYPYVLPAASSTHGAQYAHAVFVLNQVIQWSFIGSAVGIGIALVVHAVQTVRELRRMAKAPRGPAAMQISQLL